MARRAPLEDPRDQSGRYGRWRAYFESKLADLLFIFELDRRAREQKVPVKGLAAHPGYSATGLMGTGRNTGNTGEKMRWTANDPAGGLRRGRPACPRWARWPTLMAATADLPGLDVRRTRADSLQMKGPPRIVDARRLAHDREAQRELWELSEKTTGVRFLDG